MKKHTFLILVLNVLSMTSFCWSQNSISVSAQVIHTDALSPSGYTIWPIWNRFNIMDVNGVANATRHPLYEFMEEAIIVTATGGGKIVATDPDTVDNELYDPNDISGNHQFYPKLKPALDLLMGKGIKPIMVIGNTPVLLSNRPTDFGRHFGNTVGEPTDYGGTHGYNDYIKDLFAFLKLNYQSAAIPLSHWEFRLMSEPDNHDWWDPAGVKAPCRDVNLEKYWTLYSNTSDAMWQGLGSAIPLNLGNMVIPDASLANNNCESSWTRSLSNRIENSIYYIHAFSYSFYAQLSGNGIAQMGNDPRELRLVVNRLRLRTKLKWPYSVINLDETGLIVDEAGRKGLNNQADATHVGAAWLAAMLKNAFDAKVNRYVLWDNFKNPDGNPTLTATGEFLHPSSFTKTPAHNALSLFTKMRDQQRMSADVLNSNGSDFPYVDAFAGKSGSKTSVIVFSYDPNRANVTSSNYTFSITGLAPRTSWVIKKHLIDATHSNYLPLFYSGAGGFDSVRNLMTQTVDGIPADSASEFNAGVSIWFASDTTKSFYYQDIFVNRTYEANDELQMVESRVVASDASGTVTIPQLAIGVNSVMYFEVTPISLVPITSLLLF